MSDAYQAIYDATRSRIQGGDIGNAVENAIRDMNLSFYFENAMSAIAQAASCHEEPSAIYRPKIYMDGDQWCALYGDNLQDGVCGFGDSPALAMNDFNKNWYTKSVALKSAAPTAQPQAEWVKP